MTETQILARREFLRVAVGAGALSVLMRLAWAQPYPVRPVRIGLRCELPAVSISTAAPIP